MGISGGFVAICGAEGQVRESPASALPDALRCISLNPYALFLEMPQSVERVVRLCGLGLRGRIKRKRTWRTKWILNWCYLVGSHKDCNIWALQYCGSKILFFFVKGASNGPQ